MAQKISQGSIFGRIGSGIGKGFAEQLPKEVERGRLAQGLQQFADKSKQQNMSPMEMAANLYGIPGVAERPQLVKSLSDLAMMESQGRALSREIPTEQQAFGIPPQQQQTKHLPNPRAEDYGLPPAEQEYLDFSSLPERKGSQIPERGAAAQAEKARPPSLTTEELSQRVQEGYIPPNRQQKMAMAADLYQKNPSLYQNNPQNAIAAVDEAVRSEEQQQQAYEAKYKNLSDLQQNVVSRLGSHSQKLNVAVPANVYSKIEDEAIQATKPKKEGGEGLTEQQAMKKYGDKLDTISREYSDLSSVGNWSVALKPSKTTLSQLNSLQKSFKSRGDTRNMADSLIANSKISPRLAYAVAEPVGDTPTLARSLREVTPIETIDTGFETVYPEEWGRKSLDVAKKIAPTLGTTGSPLAVAWELQKKNYDPQVWIDYLTENQRDLNLTVNQVEQLRKATDPVTPWNDWWLSSFTGIGE